MPELYEHLKNGRHDRRRAVKKTVNAQPAQKRAWPYSPDIEWVCSERPPKSNQAGFRGSRLSPGGKKKGSAPLCTERAPGVEVAGVVPTSNQLAG